MDGQNTCRIKNGSRVSNATNLLRLKRMLKKFPDNLQFFKSRSVSWPSFCDTKRNERPPEYSSDPYFCNHAWFLYHKVVPIISSLIHTWKPELNNSCTALEDSPEGESCHTFDRRYPQIILVLEPYTPCDVAAPHKSTASHLE